MASVRVTPNFPGTAAADVAVGFAGGLSTPVPLPGSGLAALVPAAAPPGSTWRVTARAVPAADLGVLVARLERTAGSWEVALFGKSPAGLDARDKALWESDLPLPYRLGAVLLALARRTAEARLGEVADAR